MPLSFFAFLALATTTCAQQAPAAIEPANLRVTIEDAMGAVISDATAEITNSATSGLIVLRSDNAGLIKTSALPPGRYSIRVQATGFKPLVREGIILSAGQSLALELSMDVTSTGGVLLEATDSTLADGLGTWDLGAFLGGGTGAGKSSNTQFLLAGGRGGLILSPDLFTSTPIRGNFEYAVEVMPVYTVFTPSGAVYGASIKPIILQWNFTRPRTVIPYLHIAGGVLFTTSDVPPPNTSSINFTPQIGGGIHWFRDPNHSIDFGVDCVHHSNASLGDHNPGYNASVFFSVGYSWYKKRK